MPENAVVKYEPSAISAKTYENLQLNAGVFLEDFDYSSATDKASFKALLEQAITARTGLLGATRGGGTFVATPEIREPEVDGKRYRVKGLTIVDSWDVRLTGTLLEAYPGNFKRTLASADIASTPTSGTATKEVITLRTSIENTDYIDKLAWVTMMGDGSYMVIELQNVINLDGVTFTFSDKSEGTLPFSFAATQAGIADQNKAPFSITYFK